MAIDSKEQRARDAALATAQYEADAQVVREKTKRLRELRLAHEAATKIEKSSSKKRKAPKAGAGTAGAKTEDLSKWLATQKDQGRRT